MIWVRLAGCLCFPVGVVGDTVGVAWRSLNASDMNMENFCHNRTVHDQLQRRQEAIQASC
jgi:hypothetical protein